MHVVDNRDQQEFWTDIAGPKWVAHQHAMDACLQPVLDGVLARADLSAGRRVLDIGCGTGASVLQAADRVGDTGHVMGADISTRLLQTARTRAEGRHNVSFIEADAASHMFASQAQDRLISRFGVMFFADPTAAFSNIIKGLKSGAHVSMAAWGQVQKNPYFTLAAQAARDVLGPMPKPDLDAPGPFAFRDPDRVHTILTDAGFTDVDIDVVDVDLAPMGTLEDFSTLVCSIGPAEAALKHFEANAAQTDAVVKGIHALYAPLVTPQGLRIPSEMNFITAKAP